MAPNDYSKYQLTGLSDQIGIIGQKKLEYNKNYIYRLYIGQLKCQ